MRLDRITLLRPNMGDYRSTDGLPPMSMSILAAHTPKDIEISFYDDNVEVIPKDDQPDLVAITVETFTARRAYELAMRYRERDITVVMGGYHPSFLPDEALQHADAIVIGDAEGSWSQLIDDARKRPTAKDLPGRQSSWPGELSSRQINFHRQKIHAGRTSTVQSRLPFHL